MPERSSKLWLKIGVSVVVATAAIAIMAYSISKSSGVYLKVDQLVNNKEKWVGKTIWLGGRLAKPDKPEPEAKATNTHHFQLEWGGERISVRYRGDLPSGFIPEARITLKGKLTEKGIFEAIQVTTKCPSKYKARE